MSYTPFSPDNKRFTDKCHELAQQLIYPKLFNIAFKNLSFTDSSLGTNEKNTILDGQMAIDRLVKVTADGFNAPVELTFQERFRKPEYARWRDITITEWNTITNIPSELYKLNSGIFIYGYANSHPTPTGFIEVIAVDTVKMLLSIIKGDINCGLEMNRRTEQTFITITFPQLFKANCVLADIHNVVVETTTQLPIFTGVYP